MFAPRRPYTRARDGRLCSRVHPQPCTYGCRTCHFCRQRTVEPKTACAACEGRNNFYGGPGRGYWCGSCLWLRVGENADEARARPDWLCPACRDICNCSGANCQRLKRGWFPTNQLAHEATAMGYPSVAHYLILTHVGEQVAAAPMGPGAAAARPAGPPAGAVDGPLQTSRTKRQRLLELAPTRRQALRDAATPLLAALHSNITRELQRFRQMDASAALLEGGGTGGGVDDAGVPAAAPSGLLWSAILDASIEEADEGLEGATEKVSLAYDAGVSIVMPLLVGYTLIIINYASIPAFSCRIHAIARPVCTEPAVFHPIRP